MEDLIGLLIFIAIGVVSVISKAKEKKSSVQMPLPRKKIPRQSLNNRPIKQSAGHAQRLDNQFQRDLNTSFISETTETSEIEEHAVFEHDHNFKEEKSDAIRHGAATVKYGHSRAVDFANFIHNEGQNAIVVGEILGKPKGWE